jgi:hypothetical protein
MIMSSSSRWQNLNMGVLLIVVFAALQAKLIFPDLEKRPLVQAVVIVTSIGLYELIFKILFFLINTSEVLLRLYWGRLYINGLWSYEYTLEGKLYFGVWEIYQDVSRVQVVGNGLDNNMRVRTIVRSVSPLIEEQGGLFVLNSRNELANQNARVFSKTTLLLDRPRRPWGLVRSMRAITEIYGGPSDKQVHPNVLFYRHPDAGDIEHVIRDLGERLRARGVEVGGADGIRDLSGRLDARDIAVGRGDRP